MKKRVGGVAVESVPAERGSKRSATVAMDEDEMVERARDERADSGSARDERARDEHATDERVSDDRPRDQHAPDELDPDPERDRDAVEAEASSGTDPESTADVESSAGEAASDELATQAGNELSDDELLTGVTALVYASPEPLSERRLVALLEGPEPARVQRALAALKERLEASGLPLELAAIAGGWQILTAPAMAETVQRLFKARKAERVSPAALETLAVVAYRQPVTKAEIEAIRGVQVGPILRMLVDRGLVRVTGRADVPGHPLQYGTTRAFLERFGLDSIDDLPRDSELAKG